MRVSITFCFVCFIENILLAIHLTEQSFRVNHFKNENSCTLCTSQKTIQTCICLHGSELVYYLSSFCLPHQSFSLMLSLKITNRHIIRKVWFVYSNKSLTRLISTCSLLIAHRCFLLISFECLLCIHKCGLEFNCDNVHIIII